MSKGIFLLVISILSSGFSNAQNYGYLGRKNIISGGAQMTLLGKRLNNKTDLKLCGSLERSIHHRFSVFGEFQFQNTSSDQVTAAANSLKVKSPDARYDWAIYGLNYSMDLRARSYTVGLKYFLAEKGAIAPFGAYLLLSNDVSFYGVRNAVIKGQVEDNFISDEYKNAEIKNMEPITVKMHFLNLGFGQSRIFFDRIYTDFSLGMSTSFYNSTPFGNGGIFNTYSSLDLNHPEDVLKYEIAESASVSKVLWIKYKIGFIF